MKKTILIMMMLITFLVSCKKGEKCLIGGKWYHVKTVIGGINAFENNKTWIEFKNDGYVYFSDGGKELYISTDTEINKLPYQCKGKTLKISTYLFSNISLDHALSIDFDKNYEEYKR